MKLDFEILVKQIENHFQLWESDIPIYRVAWDRAKEELKTCLGIEDLSMTHTDQYCMLLYLISANVANDSFDLADRVYYLNKIMNGVDMYHQIKMPARWQCFHPVGSVMGRATYGTGFKFMQGCTVGNNRFKHPVIGKNVTMYSHSKILGRSIIGDNVKIGTGVTILDTDIPSNCTVYTKFNNVIVLDDTLTQMYEISMEHNLKP